MSNGDPVSLAHTIWSTILTAFGGLIFWNGRRLYKQLDDKADKDSVDEKHLENKTALGKIEQTLMRADAVREDMWKALGEIDKKVGILLDRDARRRP